jgi:uncharacterized repeat protein (TIGR01451 family)
MTRRAAVRLTLALGVVWFGAATQLRAQGALSVEVVNGYNLVVDSNVTAPSTYAPRSAYIGARICNTGNASLDNVFAYVGNYAGNTPGIFPSSTFSSPAPQVQLYGTGSYSLTIEAHTSGAADGTRYVGTLAAGACTMQYWLISYPQCVNVGGQPQSPPCDASITGDVKPSDDPSLRYDVWATTTGAIAQPTVTQSRSFTMRNEISAAANKIWPNTTAKVPPEYLAAIESVIGWGTLGPDGQPLTPTTAVYPGERLITTQGIWYDLGNVGQGFDNDGDLVPDQNAWLQPVGDPSSFDADCFRMLNVYGIVIVKLKSGGDLLIPFQNQLYFEHLPDNNGVVGLVYYQYIATDGVCNANMTPYQEAASGFDNEKFSADYGLSLGLNSRSFGADLAFSKTDGQTSAATGSTLTYAATATNNTGVNLGTPELGTPIVFRETVPAGTTFVAGSADDSPNTNLTEPTGTGTYTKGYTDRDGNLDTCTINYAITGSSYVILYSNNNGISWTTTEPAGVTDIQWWLTTSIALDGGHDRTDCIAPNGVYDNGTVQTSLPPGKSTTLRFQVTVNPTGGPIVCNTARLGIGGAASSTVAEDCTLITGNNSLSGTVFRDNGTGTGGIYGNGGQDGTESGIGAGVIVALYYDRNGNGRYDSGDVQYGTTTTAAGGTYSFSNLPDGPYVAVVKKYDGPSSDGLNNAATDAGFSTNGWGNTTFDPNLPLGTDQGILKLNEDLATVSLAVNIDLDKNNAAGQTVSGVNFGFAPPFRLLKTVTGMAHPATEAAHLASAAIIDEGDVFSYTIDLENRLPSVGRQGPTGCEYTAWAQIGVNGTPANKEFTNAPNAWDATSPNRSAASALVTGGGLRYIYGTGFALADQLGAISKVEALYFGYFSSALTDDFLNLAARLGAGVSTGTISTAMIDSYVGMPANTDPNSAISWDITSRRPGGGTWSWTDDFTTLQFEINPSKASSADQKTFYLDAIGLRVTTDRACESSASTTLSPVPLQDTYDAGSFTFVGASPAPTSVDTGTGVIRWNDVGPILPGSTTAVTVTLRAANVSGTRAGNCGTSSPPAVNSTCNWAETAYTTHHVAYADGRLANDDQDRIAVSIVGKAELRGTVWNDANDSGWNIGVGEAGLPGVIVTLYACLQGDGVTLETGSANNKICTDITNGNAWRVMARATTDTSGNYEFIGLDTGYYLIEVGDTDGSPIGGNGSPFGRTQTAEANDAQDSAAGSANGHTCPTCNNIWGTYNAFLRADQTTINLLSAGSEEKINGINFGYYAASGLLYGSVWHDINGSATADPGELGLAGFTVQLYSDPNGDGNPADGALLSTITSDSSGNYAFSGLSAASYVILVMPPALPTEAWVETVETTGGTSSLDNRIPVTLSAGQVSGSHEFGYTLRHTSTIGDTVFLDFNGNGRQDPTEAGIPNITVWLYRDVDRNGTIDAGVDALIATDVTDASGRYLFGPDETGSARVDLPAGSYIVVVDTRDPDFPSNVTPTADPDVNAASLGGQIYLDASGNGSHDAGEDGIAGVSIHLYSNTNGDNTIDPGEPLIAATVTNVDGSYLFTGLNAGNYLAEVDTTTLPSTALTRTSAAFTNIWLASNAASSTYPSADAGYSPSANYALGNRVWHDVDGDGVQDSGEPGIGGVHITVTNGTGTGCSPSCTATTDDAGFWLVTGLTNGTFSVSASSGLPRDFVLTTGTSPRTVTVNSADLLSVDFAYRYSTPASSPTGSITGRVFEDANGNRAYDSGEARSGKTVNLLNAAHNVVATTTTAAEGTYAFNGVFIGEYAVQAVDELGTRYSVVFLSAAEAFPNLNVIYDRTIETTADSQSSVSVDGVHPDLMQDFGYQRFVGSIGDTVYLDANENASQDVGEPGIGGVTVRLYQAGWSDINNNGVVESGETTGETLLQTTVTTADDPLTAADEGGKYLFTNLPSLPAGQYYLVRVDTSTLPGTRHTLTADPDTDGIPCTILPDPDVAGDAYPPPGVCDSAQLVRGFTPGINYLGADFGYRITGAGYGFFGDHLWIDTDGDGQVDTSEPGVRYVTLWLDTNNNGVLDAGERTTQTDADGYYLFTGLADGTYNVRVLTSDPDWPAGLPTTPVFEARSGNAASLDNHVGVVIAGGVVTSIIDGDPASSDPCTGCELSVDFGYRYAGANVLSGTVCVDDPARNGFCGATATTYSGVASGSEVALGGLTIGLYRWTDDGDNTAWGVGGALDPGDTFTFLGSTTTDANGDYSFTNVPDNVIVVLGLAASQNLRLTTTNASTSVEDANVISRQLYEATSTNDGHTVTVVARQALSLAGDVDHNIRDLDFAFDGTLGGSVLSDFGDLPESGTPDYHATLLANGGAEHRVVVGSSIHLGATITTENDGQPNADATGDSGDDGVSLVSTALVAGPAGGAVNVSASAAGWIAGWIDFNGDGDFADEGERIVNGPVTVGSSTITFDVPYEFNGGVSGTDLAVFARFRIYPAEPLLVSATGAALDASFQPTSGEVEDYRWTVSVTEAVVSGFGARETRAGVAVEWRTSSESGTLGFYLKRWDSERSEYVEVNKRIVPAVLRPQGGRYSVLDPGATPRVNARYELVEVEFSGRQHVYGPYVVNTASARQMAAGSLAEQVTQAAEEAGFARLAHARRLARAEAWRAGMQVAGPPEQAMASMMARAPALKLAVHESGMYYVDLRGQHQRLAGRLTNLGRSVMTDRQWAGFLFYGQALDSLYSADNVYRLDPAADVSPQMPLRVDRPLHPPTGGETFRSTVHAEQNLVPATALFDDPESDYWVWDWIFAGEGPKTFTFRTDALAADAAEQAVLTVRLKGASDTVANPDHHAVISVNGQQVGEISWNGLELAVPSLSVDPRWLHDGENTLEIVGLGDTGAEYSLFFLDAFDVTYTRQYRALGNRLACAADGNAALLLTGFSRPDVLVFDVSDPLRPMRVQGTPRRAADHSYAIAVAPPKPTTAYYAVTPDALLTPTSIETDWPSKLRKRDNAAQYLLITRASLRPAAQCLADYRSDLSSMVVDIEDVYDEFGFSVPSPHALRDFLLYARMHWATPPRYVLLVGDGSIDYRDVDGYGENVVPTMLVRTPNGLYPSDTWLADVDVRGAAPEMAIGRLPVSSEEQLDAIVAKIQKREAELTEPWQTRLLVVADNPDGGGDFPADSEVIAALASASMDVERLYLPALGASETRRQLLEGINEGVGTVSYVGHAGLDVLASEGLLWSQDIDTLTNAERPIVLTAMTCMANHFAHAGYPSLGELLVRHATGGAVASFGPTGLSENHYAMVLARAYYSAAASRRFVRIGDVIQYAMKTYETGGGPGYMLGIYALLGDPAMRLR